MSTKFHHLSYEINFYSAFRFKKGYVGSSKPFFKALQGYRLQQSSIKHDLPTGMPHMSACSCISSLLMVSLPSAWSLVSATPQSLCIASSMSLVWKHIASSAARIMWFLVVNCVKPHMILETLKQLCQYAYKSV
jgi:hypothetical protein